MWFIFLSTINRCVYGAWSVLLSSYFRKVQQFFLYFVFGFRVAMRQWYKGLLETFTLQSEGLCAASACGVAWQSAGNDNSGTTWQSDSAVWGQQDESQHLTLNTPRKVATIEEKPAEGRTAYSGGISVHFVRAQARNYNDNALNHFLFFAVCLNYFYQRRLLLSLLLFLVLLLVLLLLRGCCHCRFGFQFSLLWIVCETLS